MAAPVVAVASGRTPLALAVAVAKEPVEKPARWVEAVLAPRRAEAETPVERQAGVAIQQAEVALAAHWAAQGPSAAAARAPCVVAEPSAASFLVPQLAEAPARQSTVAVSVLARDSEQSLEEVRSASVRCPPPPRQEWLVASLR